MISDKKEIIKKIVHPLPDNERRETAVRSLCPFLLTRSCSELFRVVRSCSARANYLQVPFIKRRKYPAITVNDSAKKVIIPSYNLKENYLRMSLADSLYFEPFLSKFFFLMFYGGKDGFRGSCER